MRTLVVKYKDGKAYRVAAEVKYVETSLQPADVCFRSLGEARAFVSGLQSGMLDSIDCVQELNLKGEV